MPFVLNAGPLWPMKVAVLCVIRVDGQYVDRGSDYVIETLRCTEE